MPSLHLLPLQEIEAAVKRVNGEHQECPRCGIDFARAFLELLRKKYQNLQTKHDLRTFDQLMDDLLNALYCFDSDTRSAYRQIAGIVLGTHGNFQQKRMKAAGISPLEHKKNAALHRSLFLDARQYRLKLRRPIRKQRSQNGV